MFKVYEAIFYINISENKSYTKKCVAKHTYVSVNTLLI